MNQMEMTSAGLDSTAEDCARFGELIGLGRPVTSEVFARAVDDPEYARNLILCRESPPLRDFLLGQAKEWAVPPEPAPVEKTSLELVAKAAESFWAWTKSGFALVDQATYSKRYDACLACPHLRAAPTLLAYKLAGADENRNRVCGLCGCVASRKARLPHETCPGAHPERSGFNRWEEPMGIEENISRIS